MNAVTDRAPFEAIANGQIKQLLSPDGYYAQLHANTEGYVSRFNAHHPESAQSEGLAAIVPMAALVTRITAEAISQDVVGRGRTDVMRREWDLHDIYQEATLYAQGQGAFDDYLAATGTDFNAFYDYYLKRKGRTQTSQAVDAIVAAPLTEMRTVAGGVLGAAEQRGLSVPQARQLMKSSSGMWLIGAAREGWISRPEGVYIRPEDILITVPDDPSKQPTAAFSEQIVETLELAEARQDKGARSGCPVRQVKDPIGGMVFRGQWDQIVDFLLADGATINPRDFEP